MKLRQREFPHLWERLKQQYQLTLAKGQGWSGEDAAESFNNALEDEISSLKTKGESCSPAELCRIKEGERRLENLKRKHNWKALVACVKCELQIVHGRRGRRDTDKERQEKSTRGSAEGAREGQRGSAEGRGKRQEEISVHSLASVATPRWERLGSGGER